MTEIIEKAKELGALLQSSEQVQKYNAAKAAYDSDEAVQKLIKEYNLHRMTMMSLSNADDAERMAEVEERIKGVYNQVIENDKYKAMQEAGAAVEAILSQVNGVLTFYVTGEEPQSCTHDCSTCGGCH